MLKIGEVILIVGVRFFRQCCCNGSLIGRLIGSRMWAFDWFY